MSMLAEKEGIALTEQEVETMANRLKGFREDATSSMHQDMRKGLSLEVEHLHGGALRLAAKHHVTVPVIETLYGILKPSPNDCFFSILYYDGSKVYVQYHFLAFVE